jgi:hypothetical protein
MTAMRRIEKPRPGEFPAYASMYIDLLPDDGRVLEHLERNIAVVRGLVGGLPPGGLRHRYAPDKWSVAEVLLHVIDDERIYAYRALRIARSDPTELPGFDQDLFAAHSAADQRTAESLLDEHAAVRRATLTLFAGLPDAAFTRRGVANGAPVSVRALAYHIAGHEVHHLNVLRERYL